MGKLTQKQLLEGLGSALRKGISATARGAAAVGGALRQASAAGERATVGDFIRGGKAGYEAEKLRQKSPETELAKAIEEFGFVQLGAHRGNINDVLTVQVADLDYDIDGNPKKGTPYTKPLILKWDKKNKAFRMVKSPRWRPGSSGGSGTSTGGTP